MPLLKRRESCHLLRKILFKRDAQLAIRAVETYQEGLFYFSIAATYRYAEYEYLSSLPSKNGQNNIFYDAARDTLKKSANDGLLRAMRCRRQTCLLATGGNDEGDIYSHFSSLTAF